jgi:hypothetical protein
MSKRTFIILGIIAGLFAVILFQKYLYFPHVPTVHEWKGEADEITIKNKNGTVHITRQDGKWVIGDESFPADQNTVNSLVKRMNDLSFTVFVSKKDLYERFNLTDELAVRVTVKGKGQPLRDLLIGKQNQSSDQSYVKYPDKPEVYLAGGGLASEFNKTADALRDKVLLSYPIDTIDAVTIKFAGDKYTVKRESPADKSKDEDPLKEDKEKPQAAKWVVEGRTGNFDQGKIAEFLNEFGSVTAMFFPSESEIKSKIASPASEITLHSKGKEIKLVIYDKYAADKSRGYVCRSSENPYYAVIPDFKAEKLQKRISELIIK